MHWDPYDVEIDTNPYEIWRWMRDEAPVYRNDEYDFWALSRFEDVDWAHRQPKLLSSAHGTVLEIMGPNELKTGQMIFMDPPEHTEMRSLMSRAFTPRRVAALEERIRELCNEFLDDLDGKPSFDFVQDYGARLPAMVIASLLGVPRPDQPHVRELIDTLFHLEGGLGMANETAAKAGAELGHYLKVQLEQRVDSPQDDMLTALADTGIPIFDQVGFATLLIAAGTETVARNVGWAGYVLDANPDQRAELAADRTLLPNAVEELLRYEAPSPVQGRWLTEPLELHGVAIPQGSRVLLLTGSAGRDERKYPDADRFDIHRNFDHHVSFGYGVHFCLGAALARMEGRIAIEEMLKRHPEWSVDQTNSRRLHTSTVRGWVNLIVSV